MWAVPAPLGVTGILQDVPAGSPKIPMVWDAVVPAQNAIAKKIESEDFIIHLVDRRFARAATRSLAARFTPSREAGGAAMIVEPLVSKIKNWHQLTSVGAAA